MGHFVLADRDTDFLLPPSIQDWLPEDHLARFVVEFVQVLLLAREMNLVKLGRIALDGTKVKANAIKHKALSYAHAKRIEAQLKAEVSALAAQAEAADQRKAAPASEATKRIAWQAQKRLCGRYRDLIQAGKNSKLVCVVIARELAGLSGQSSGKKCRRFAVPRTPGEPS